MSRYLLLLLSCFQAMIILRVLCHLENFITFRVKNHGAFWCSVSKVPRPPRGIAFTSRQIYLITLTRNQLILFGVPLTLADAADSSFPVFDIIPIYKLRTHCLVCCKFLNPLARNPRRYLTVDALGKDILIVHTQSK